MSLQPPALGGRGSRRHRRHRPGLPRLLLCFILLVSPSSCWITKLSVALIVDPSQPRSFEALVTKHHLSAKCRRETTVNRSRARPEEELHQIQAAAPPFPALTGESRRLSFTIFRRKIRIENLCPSPGSIPPRNVVAPCDMNFLVPNQRRTFAASVMTFITSSSYKPESTTVSEIQSRKSRPIFSATTTHNSGAKILPSATKHPLLFRSRGLLFKRTDGEASNSRNMRSEPPYAAHLRELKPERSSTGRRLQETGAAKTLKLGRTCLVEMASPISSPFL